MKQSIHNVCRTQKPPDYPDRLWVSDENVAWTVEWPEYNPPSYTAAVVLANDCTQKSGGWADPENLAAALALRPTGKFESYLGPVTLDQNGYPLNPMGRTGLSGRGILGKWGANVAADPIVLRWNDVTSQWEMITILRKKPPQLWAIPGGMADLGENPQVTAARELREEAGVEVDFSKAVVVFQEYVDDPRNTDQAWTETTALLVVLDWEASTKLMLRAGDDAQEVRWMPLTDKNLSGMYASHADMVRLAMQSLS